MHKKRLSEILPKLSPTVALKIFFTTQALGLSLWLLRIPQVKTSLQMDLIDLSLALFMQPVGILCGFFLAPLIIQITGNKKSCQYFGSLFIVTFIFIPFANSFFFLAANLLISGLICATVEVSMNALAAEIEKGSKKRMMSGFHAFWSVGALFSGIIVTIFTALSISFRTQQITIIPILILVTILITFSLPKDSEKLYDPRNIPKRKILPTFNVLILAITPFGALLLEGAMMEWTAVFKGNFHNLTPTWVGIIFCTFTSFMVVSRFFGDHLVEKLKVNKTLELSMVLSFLGMLLYALNSSSLTSIIAASMVGAGIANIYPITISLVATEPGSKERNVSLVALISFTSFLTSAPLIGFLGDKFGLDKAFAFIAPLSLLPILYLFRKKTRYRFKSNTGNF